MMATTDSVRSWSLPPDVLRELHPNSTCSRACSSRAQRGMLARDEGLWTVVPGGKGGRLLFSCETKGHLECLRYAHEHGCPWKATRAYAARQGHLECLRYAHEHGCPWKAVTCAWAAGQGAPGVSAVRARARLPLESCHVRLGCGSRAPGVSAVRAKPRLPVSGGVLPPVRDEGRERNGTLGSPR